MNFADDGAAAGTTIVTVLTSLGTIIVWVAKWLRERERRRAMASVPPTPGHEPPAATDQTLARLDRAEQHDALVGALLKAQRDIVDTQRKLELLRNECTKLALRVHALEGDVARKDVQLRAERLATQVLREQLAHVEQELVTARSELEVAHADLRRALLVRG